MGVSDVIVSLSTTGFSDTTDSIGIYTISVSWDSIQSLGINLDEIKDTLTYIKNDAPIAVTEVMSWIDTKSTIRKKH